ncbi:hypothetical protein J6590_060018 [Homalodisca vitripennis]|nr:hypothetical protein J6590_060018 [Homalodisca vitripennis]
MLHNFSSNNYSLLAVVVGNDTTGLERSVMMLPMAVGLRRVGVLSVNARLIKSA